jgi:uncharacterized protein YhjY with autotransporter beta-barrel domain
MSNISTKTGKNSKSSFMVNTMLSGLVAAGVLVANPAHALVTPNTTTPAAVVDTTNTRPYWVGLAISNEAGNSGGTCTGLLINPRTVLFAAHCVDGLAPAAYNGNSVGNRARVGYTTDPTFGRANVRNFLFGQDFGTQPGSDGRTMINSNFVWYDPRSRFGSLSNPATQGTFLPADVAIAGFDTPTELLGRDASAGIGLLFSPVTGLVPVTIGGYGESGNGQTGVRTSGNAAESYFRRLGSNMLGFLGDERSISVGVYGTAVGNLFEPEGLVYQDLYWMDFDDPNRATRPFFAGPGNDPLCVSTNLNCRLDHDVFAGNAVAGETITGAGDSGSPLVTNAFGREVSLGVLSQGSRFFYDSIGTPNDNFVRSTAFSNYGTIAGYNPLFLFWDQIVVNNPYKYVTTRAGDGEWTDATRWVQELDPLYFVLGGDNALVNGVPTTPALGVSSATPNVGTVRPSPAPVALCAFTGTCPPTGGTDDPVVTDGSNTAMPGYQTATGESKTGGASADAVPSESAGTGVDGTYIAGSENTTGRTEMVADGTGASRGGASSEPVALAASGAGTIVGTPSKQESSTLPWTSGLLAANSGALTGPGSTNFVANNVLGVAGTQNSTRWFEVNLRAAGTTFLTNTNVTIDRLNVRGAQSGLNIRSNGSLTTELSSFVDAGMLTVDGRLTSRMLTVAGGMVAGSGTIAARDGLMITGGVLTPGALGGGVGTLNVTGPTVFSGAGMLGIDVASATSADVLNVAGRLTLGGTLAVNTAGGYVPAFGTTWTVGSATGGIGGAFNTLASNLPGVLRPEAIVSGNNLQVRITALPFDAFLAGRATAEQIGVGAALNQVRGVAGTGSAADLFAGIDRLDAASLTAAFDGMKPTNALAVNQNVRLDSTVAATAIFDRLARTRSAERGTMAINVSGAAGLLSGQGFSRNSILMSNMMDSATTENTSAISIAPDWSIFASATYGYGDTKVQANSSSEPTAWTITAGADRRVSEQIIFGFGASYQSGDAGLSLVGNTVDTEGWSINGYAALDLTPKTKIDTWVRVGKGTLDTTRVQALGTSTFTSAGSADTNSLGWGTTFSHTLNEGPVTWTPVLSVIASKTTIDAYTENTGSTALRIDERDVSSLLVKFGMQVAGDWSAGATKLRPYGRLSAVTETEDEADVVTARFVSGGANAVPFTVVGVTPTGSFGEIGAGFSVEGSKNLTLSVEANQTFGRDELELGSVTVTGRLRF